MVTAFCVGFGLNNAIVQWVLVNAQYEGLGFNESESSMGFN